MEPQHLEFRQVAQRRRQHALERVAEKVVVEPGVELGHPTSPDLDRPPSRHAEVGTPVQPRRPDVCLPPQDVSCSEQDVAVADQTLTGVAANPCHRHRGRRAGVRPPHREAVALGRAILGRHGDGHVVGSERQGKLDSAGIGIGIRGIEREPCPVVVGLGVHGRHAHVRLNRGRVGSDRGAERRHEVHVGTAVVHRQTRQVRVRGDREIGARDEGRGPIAVALVVARADLHVVLGVHRQSRDRRPRARQVLWTRCEIRAVPVAVLQIVALDWRTTRIVRSTPPHLEVYAGRHYEGRSRRCDRGFSNVGDIDRHVDGVTGAGAVVGLDAHPVEGAGFVVQGTAGLDLAVRRVDREMRRVRPKQRVRQGIVVAVRCGHRRTHVRTRRRVLRHAAGGRGPLVEHGRRVGSVVVHHSHVHRG